VLRSTTVRRHRSPLVYEHEADLMFVAAVAALPRGSRRGDVEPDYSADSKCPPTEDRRARRSARHRGRAPARAAAADATPRHPGRNLFTFRNKPGPPAPSTPERPALTEALRHRCRSSRRCDCLASLKTRARTSCSTGVHRRRRQELHRQGRRHSCAALRVTKISADVVELTDINDNTVRRLAMR